MAALGRAHRAGQPGGPGADHRDALAQPGRGEDSSVSWQARGLTRQEVILPPKVWSRQAWLQPMQVLISSGVPGRGLVDEVGVGEERARHATPCRRSPSASSCSATSGVLIRLVATSGTATAPMSFFVTQAKAPRGTVVAMVGMRASCQPMPVLMMVAPAASTAWAS